MKSKGKYTPKGLAWLKLSQSIGDFIRYWGFRRVHGAVWAQLYLSSVPLSCTALAKNLKLSKSLISPALDELLKYKVIEAVDSPNDKVKLYRAVQDIDQVIKSILREREAKILSLVVDRYDVFSSEYQKYENVDPEKVKALGEMIIAANVMLSLLVSEKSLIELPSEFRNKEQIK